MKSRLKKVSNHVEPTIHEKVEDIVVNHSFDNTNENQSESFLFTKQLFAATPFIATGTLAYEFAARIDNGDYDSLGPISDADGNWEEWLLTLNDFLNEKETKVLASNLKKKIAGQNNLYGDGYTDTLYTNDYLNIYKDTPDKPITQSKTEKENYIGDSFSLAKDLINSLPIVPRYDLMSQLAQDIERGSFDDICDISNAKNHWDEWLSRTRSILRSRNIILSRLKTKKN